MGVGGVKVAVLAARIAVDWIDDALLTTALVESVEYGTYRYWVVTKKYTPEPRMGWSGADNELLSMLSGADPLWKLSNRFFDNGDIEDINVCFAANRIDALNVYADELVRWHV